MLNPEILNLTGKFLLDLAALLSTPGPVPGPGPMPGPTPMPMTAGTPDPGPEPEDVPPPPEEKEAPEPPKEEKEAPAPPPQVNKPAPGVELDEEGLPWDERIHTAAKTKLKRGGTWKLKRGIDKVYVAQVKTELRQAQTGEAPPPVPKEERPMDFMEFLKLLTAKGLDQDYIEKTIAVNCDGCTTIADLSANPEWIPTAAVALGL